MGDIAKVTLWKESRGAKPRRRREAGSRAHACFPTHSPHGLHRRGAPTTGTHEHTGTKPADQESTTECPQFAISSVWLVGKQRPEGNAMTQSEQ